MTYTYNFPNLTSGLDGLIVGTVSEVPAFIPMLLLFIYCVVALGGSIAQKMRLGTFDFPLWLTLAGITTFISSLIMTLTIGIIDLTTLGVVIAVTVLTGFWLFFDRKNTEI